MVSLCPKCSNTGSYYTEPYAGVIQIHPCYCSKSIQIRQAQEQEFKRFEERLEEACERFRKQSESENRELLPST